jgi:hypothetical protein
MQLVRNEPMNAPSVDASQWVEKNDQHQIVAKLVV